MVLPPRFTPHPKSAPGDFYVVNGECLACGIPHVIAPDLIAWTGEGVPHCCWKKQPETQAELEQAIAVFEAQELDCHRYAGTDPVILDRILSTYCDYPTASGLMSNLEILSRHNSRSSVPEISSLEFGERSQGAKVSSFSPEAGF